MRTPIALCRKIVGLRVFEDDAGRFARSLDEVGGELLVVSQFTLYGDCRRGRRPSFTDAAPRRAGATRSTSTSSIGRARRRVPVATGRFQAHMAVALVNDGPVTLLLDTAEQLMARAGFTAISSGQITLRQGRPLVLRRRADPESRHLRALQPDADVAPDGARPARAGRGQRRRRHRGHAVGRDRRRRRSRRAASRCVLNDGTREPLDPTTLRVGAEHVLYCRVKGGAHEARFLRPAYYELMRHAEAGPAGGHRCRVGGRRVRLARAA